MPEQNAGRYHDAPYTLDEKTELPDDLEAQPLSAGHDEPDAEAVREKLEAHKEAAEEAAEEQAQRDQEWRERDPKPTPSQMLQESGREPAPDEDEADTSADTSADTGADTSSSQTSAGSESDEDCVPSGTTGEVLDWVGDDQARAQQALDAENARETPRTTLVAELEKRAG